MHLVWLDHATYEKDRVVVATAAQPQQKHECQAKTRPQNVQDNIVDVCSSMDSCPRKVLNELDAA